uniref:Uncharacterized protein n=1 Tax=viral metagenome TaxID=1070528 RepID=A0A6C0I4V3_9ZZZZ
MPKCVAESCSKSASFNEAGQLSAKYCATHKTETMINVINRMCNFDGCSCRPSYALIGNKPLFCATHKQEDMVNVMTKFCEGPNCLLTPVYNEPHLKTGRFCVTHKLDGMVNVVNKRCEHSSCSSLPSFCLPTDTRPRFCHVHKLDNMIDKKHKVCEESGCSLIPSYAVVGSKTPLYCKAHAKQDMINVKHKVCEESGCSTHPSYNFLGYSTARFCVTHKLDTMVDVVHKKCQHSLCNRRPMYNTILETRPAFCVDHKTIHMIDVATRKCASEWCVNRSYRPSFLGFCTYCFIHLFPDKPAVKNYKTKETAVVEYITSMFPNVTWVADKRVMDGKESGAKRRPDLFLDLGYQIIIIEVDENQHVDYDCSCENKRIMELSQDVGHRPIIFIRFNPDQYMSSGVKVKSCWSINSQGISVVNKNDSKEWKNRLQSLATQLQYWIDNKTEKMVEIVQLYYDE